MSACLIEHVCINATPPGSTGHRVEAYANLFENHFEKTLARVAVKPLNVTPPDSTQSASDSSTIPPPCHCILHWQSVTSTYSPTYPSRALVVALDANKRTALIYCVNARPL